MKQQTCIYAYHDEIGSIEQKEIKLKKFNGLANIKQIYFNHNEIKELRPNLFNGLVNLKIIRFSFNQINGIHSNLFNGLVNFEKI